MAIGKLKLFWRFTRTSTGLSYAYVKSTVKLWCRYGRVAVVERAMDKIGYTWCLLEEIWHICFHVRECPGEAFAKISSRSAWTKQRGTKVDKVCAW